MTSPRVFPIEIAPTAFTSLERIRDKKARREIEEAIDGLARQPQTQGKALVGPLEGLRSIRVARERYRILYRIHDGAVQVLLIGLRRAGYSTDVYAVAESLVRMLRGRR